MTTLDFLLEKAAEYGVPVPPYPMPKNRYIVTANVLNVRGGPGTQFSHLRYLIYGDTVEVLNEVNGWAQIAPGQWVSKEYLRPA